MLRRVAGTAASGLHKGAPASRALLRPILVPTPQATRLASPNLKPRTLHTTTRTMAASTRTETDAFGPLQVQSDRYWGAQTERSLDNFRINQPHDRMPPPIIKAFGILKGAAATVNMRFGLGTASYTEGMAAANQLQQIPRSAKPSSRPPRRLPMASFTTTSPSSSGRRAPARSLT